MSPFHRPSDAAPGGMRGVTRMHDPSEAAHDRVRRRCMNAAFAVILAVTITQVTWIGVHTRDWLGAILACIAAAPLGLAVKVFELRFKMAAAERRLVLRELPNRQKIQFAIHGVLVILVFLLQPFSLPWLLWGIWLYDFVTYYHGRPERMRHLYAVTKTLDEFRDFRAPWAWALPALAWEILKTIAAH